MLTDYSLISALSSRRGKRDFVSYIDQELSLPTLDTPLHRVASMRQILERDGGVLPLQSDLIVQLEHDLIGVLARMETRGVAFDRVHLTDLGIRIRTDIAELEMQIYELIGEHINLNSPKQLQVLFFEKMGIKPTKKNKTGYSVDIDVLEEIAATHDVARLILEYRSLSKLSSTYVDGLEKSIAPDGRIHTTYDSLGASTGRMSSNDPNLQNIPAGDGYAREIKECFIPSAGNILMVADYSQVELRVLAYLSQDDGLMSAFEQGEDIHMRTARFLFPDHSEITSHERRIAKSVNFGVIYGITGFGLAKTLSCSPWEAQRYVDAFYQRYPGVRTYYDTLLMTARETGYVETYFGRRRQVPGVSDANRTMRSIAEREAMNMPVQGTAADMIKIAMIELDREIRERGLAGSMILQVHDELVFDIPV
jgi:DNA polymerase I